jgi:hypothetical protein
MIEHDLQQRLTLYGALSLLSTPLTGAFGVLTAIGIFSGKLLRLIHNDTARDKYDQEQREIQRQKQQELESLRQAECAARQNQNTYTLRLMEQARSVANDYLSGLTTEQYERVNSIKIIPEYQKTFLGIPYGRKTLEILIDRQSTNNNN